MDDLSKWADSPIWDYEQSKNRYQYPLKPLTRPMLEAAERLAEGIPAEQIYRRGSFICAVSPDTHKGPFRHAIDFLVPDGTPILAAAAGKVVELVEIHEEWGDGPEYRDKLNFITIAHDNGEFSQYCHVAKGSVGVEGIMIGSRVERGQKIGLVAKNGWTDRDHLHFVVFRGTQNESPFTFKSLLPRFGRFC